MCGGGRGQPQAYEPCPESISPRGGFSTPGQGQEANSLAPQLPSGPCLFLSQSVSPLPPCQGFVSPQFLLFPILSLSRSLSLAHFDSSASHLSFPLTLHLYVSFPSGPVTQLFCFLCQPLSSTLSPSFCSPTYLSLSPLFPAMGFPKPGLPQIMPPMHLFALHCLILLFSLSSVLRPLSPILSHQFSLFPLPPSLSLPRSFSFPFSLPSPLSASLHDSPNSLKSAFSCPRRLPQVPHLPRTVGRRRQEHKQLRNTQGTLLHQAFLMAPERVPQAPPGKLLSTEAAV